MLSEELRQAILARSDLKAKPHGERLLFRCPRHEDRTPSAWMAGGAWGCFACGFEESIRSLAGELGIALRGASRGYTLEDYAEAKAFPLGKLKEFGLSTTEERGRPVVRIPYFDADGNVLRCRFRSGADKWWEGRNRPIHLYGLDRLTDAKEGDVVLIVEGESDCHAAWIEGFHAVGVPGATTWKPEWAAHLKGLTAYVWEEPDQGGPQLVASVAKDLPEVRVIHDPPVKDLSDLRREKREGFGAALRQLLATATKVGVPKPPVVFDALLGDRLDALLTAKQQPIDAVPTPFSTWNRCCADDGGHVGLARGWHVVAAAKTGTGKSILALNLAAAAIRAGERVCFVSLEMSQNEVDTRMLAIASGVPVMFLERGQRFDPMRFRRAGAYLNELHERTGGCFYSNREPIHSLQQVSDSIRFYHEVVGCRYFVVDYLQLAGNPMDPESIVAVSHTVRGLAKQLQVITVGLSQFNRITSSSKDRPTKEGLMGGSPLEQDSDQVVLIDHSRVEKYELQKADRDDRGLRTYLLLDKNRHGAMGETPIEFSTVTLRMRELLADELPSERAA